MATKANTLQSLEERTEVLGDEQCFNVANKIT
jgi:hypothetical protein